MAQEELVAILRAEIGQFKQTFDQAARIVEQTQTAATAALKQAQAAELALQRDGQAAQLAVLKQGQAAQLAAIKGAKPEELAALKAAQAAELAATKQAQTAAVAATKEGQAGQLAALKQGQAADLAATRAHQQAVLETFRQIGREEVAAVQAAQQQITQATQQGRQADVAVHQRAVAEIRATANQQRQALLEAARTTAAEEQRSAQQRVAAQQQVHRLELEAQRQAGRQRVQEVRTTNQAVQQETSGFQRVLAGALSVAGGLGIAASLAGVITSIKSLATESVAAATRMQSLTAAFTLISGGAGKAQNTLAFLRDESTRLGIDFVTSAESFKRFDAAARGTALEGEKARAIFTAVSEAMRVVGGTSDQTRGALTALEQIISKGKVSSEELRGQLGEHLPGAFQIAARAMGVTTAELGKMLETTDLLATDFIPRFGVQLRKEFGPGVEAASQTAAATFARLGNEVQALGTSFGQALLGILKPSAGFLDEILRKIREASAAQEALLARTLESARAGKPVIGGATTVEGAAVSGSTADELIRTRELTEKLAVAEHNLADARKLENANFLSGLLTNLSHFEKVEAHARQQLKDHEALIASRKNEAALNEADQASFGEYAQRQERQTAANATHKKQVEDILALHKQQTGEVEKAAANAKLLSVSFSAAEVELTALRKQAGEVQKLLEKKPTLLLDPQVKAATEALRERIAVLVKTVEVEKEQEAAGKRARAEAVQAAKARVETEKALQGELITLREDEFEAARQLLAREIAELRKNKVDETLITAIEAEKRQDILRREVEAALETLGKEQTAREALTSQETANRREIAETITGLEARESRSQVDDFRAALAAKREALVAHFATTDDLRQFDLAAERAVQRVITEEQAKALKDQQREQERALRDTERALRDQERAYEQTYGRIAQTLDGILQGVFSGTIRTIEDLLTSLQQTFLSIVSKIAAETAVRFAVGGLVGGGGAAPGLQGPPQASGAFFSGGGAGAAQAGFGLASQGAGLFGGPGAQQVLGAGALGITGGQLVNVGLGKTRPQEQLGSTAGGIAGAAIGTAFLPGIGTAAGGLLGSVLGGLLGGILGGKEKRPPEFTLQGATTPRFGFDPLTGFSLQGDFGVSSRSRNFGQGHAPVHEAIQESASQLLEGLASTIGGFPKELQERAVPELQRLADEFGATFQGVRFKGKDVEQQVSTFVNETIPETFTDLFSPFVERLKRVAPVLAEFDRVIEALEAQQADLLHTLDTARANILQGPQTPAGAFEQRRGLLDTLVAESAAGTPAEQAALVPQIAALAQEVAQLSRQEGALVSFNAELRDLHTAVEVSTGALQAQEAALVASQTALDTHRAALEGALQAQEATLDEQRQVSDAVLRGQEAALDAQRTAVDSLLQAQEDALQAEQDASRATLQTLEDALQAAEATSRASLQALEDALETEQDASRATLQALEDALDTQRAQVTAALHAEEEALREAGTALQTLEDTLQASVRVLETMAQSLASSREALTGARAALIDSVQGPAQLFESRKADLQALVRSLPGASLEGRVAAFPEIASLTEEVIQLAKSGELFGDDVAAFRQLQQQLLAQLAQAETFAQEAQTTVAGQQAVLVQQEQAAQAAFAAQQAAFLAHEQAAQAALAAQQGVLVAAQQQAQAHFAAQEAAFLQAQRHAQAGLAQQEAVLVAAQQQAQAHFAAQETQLEQTRQGVLGHLANQQAVLVAAQQHAQAHFAAQEALLLQAQQHAQAVLANQQAVLVQAQVAHQQALAAHDNLLAHEAARTQAAQQVVQQDLVRILDAQRAATDANFTQAINETRAQRDLVLTTLQVNQSQEFHLANVVGLLASINSLTAINTRRLELLGSFQTEPGEVRQIPRTGLALVHRGELIGRPGAGGDAFAPTIHLTVNAPGSAPEAVAQATTRAVEQTIRELERRRRYRQTRVA